MRERDDCPASSSNSFQEGHEFQPVIKKVKKKSSKVKKKKKLQFFLRFAYLVVCMREREHWACVFLHRSLSSKLVTDYRTGEGRDDRDGGRYYYYYIVWKEREREKKRAGGNKTTTGRLGVK